MENDCAALKYLKKNPSTLCLNPSIYCYEASIINITEGSFLFSHETAYPELLNRLS